MRARSEAVASDASSGSSRANASSSSSPRVSQQPLDSARRSGEHAHHLVGARRRQREEAERLSDTLGVPIGAVERERVEVQVQVQCRAEALEEGDGAALLGAQAPVSPHAPPQLCEERAEKRAKHLARELRVVRAAVAKWIGEREHPLPDRHHGKDAIDEMRSGVGHPAAATGRAEAAPLAREGHEAIVAAVVAVQAKKAVGEDAAAQEGAEIVLDEVRRGALASPRPGEEGLDLLADDAVQERLLRRARCVVAGAGLLADRPRGRTRAIEQTRLDGVRVGRIVLRHREARAMRPRVPCSRAPWNSATASRARSFTGA